MNNTSPIKEKAEQDFEKDMATLAKMNEIILKAVYEWYRVNYLTDDKVDMVKGRNVAKLRYNRLIILERLFLHELRHTEDVSKMIEQIKLLGCGEWQKIDEDVLRKWKNGEYFAMESLERGGILNGIFK